MMRKPFKVGVLLAIYFCVSGYATVQAKKQISVAAFGAIPDDGKNDAAGLRKATTYCRAHRGTTLYIPPGIYDFRDETAVSIERNAISGAYGENVQKKLFYPKAPYVKALDFTGCRDLKVDAKGVTLLLEGWYEVISLIRVRNVCIEGLTILYKRPPSTVGRITASNDHFFDLSIDPSRYIYLDSVVTGNAHFYDHQRNRLYTGGVSKKELIRPGLIRLHSKKKPRIGDYCILRHSGHYRPAVMIKESKSVLLKNVKIHSQPGMGVVGHLSEDITLNNLQLVPEPGSVISTNTDATHFTSCSGVLTIENCKFRGQGDDCTNIHNYYYHIYPEKVEEVEIRIEKADLHAQSLDYPTIGDSMLVLNRKSMQEQGRYRVQKVDTSTVDWKVIIQLDRPLHLEDRNKYLMTNISRFPKVRILNNTVNSHLARSFLVKSKDVLIAGNSITGCAQTAIKLGAELGWHESGPVENVIIENNYISGCGYDNAPNDPSCVVLSTEASERPPFVNRNISIRNNIFDTDKKTAILLRDAENVKISNNRATHVDYVREVNCRNIEIVR